MQHGIMWDFGNLGVNDVKNLNVKVFIYFLLIISIFVGSIILYLTETKVTGLWDAVKQLPKIVFVDLILWCLFVRWAWKWRIFQNWLVPFPSLEGTWEGTLGSTWKDPQTEQIFEPIPAILVIKQSFTSISCKMYTQEMKSKSYSAQFLIDPESNSKKMSYTYTSTPKPGVRDRSPIHNGTVLLDIIESPSRILSGEYWTSRSSAGDINLKFKCKELLQSFPNLSAIERSSGKNCN